MVFLLVLGNRSQSDLPVHFFPLYCKLSEASNGHFGFLHYLDWELGTKTVYLGTPAVGCSAIN